MGTREKMGKDPIATEDSLITLRSSLSELDEEQQIAGFAALKNLEAELEKRKEWEIRAEERQFMLEEQRAINQDFDGLLENALHRTQTATDDNETLRRTLQNIADTKNYQRREASSRAVEEREQIKKTTENLREANRILSDRGKRAETIKLIETGSNATNLGERLKEAALKSDLRRSLLQFVAVVEMMELVLPFLYEYAESADAQGFQTTASDAHVLYAAISTALTDLEKSLS